MYSFNKYSSQLCLRNFLPFVLFIAAISEVCKNILQNRAFGISFSSFLFLVELLVWSLTCIWGFTVLIHIGNIIWGHFQQV